MWYLKLQTFITSLLKNEGGRNAVEPDAELIALEREYHKWTAEKARAREKYNSVWMAHKDWPEGFNAEMWGLFEDLGLECSYTDIQKWLTKMNLTHHPSRIEERARRFHSHLLRHRVRYQEALERLGWFEAQARTKEADARQEEVFHRLMEAQAHTLSGVQIKLDVLYRETMRREAENYDTLYMSISSAFTSLAS